jgi:hypothetical protein
VSTIQGKEVNLLIRSSAVAEVHLDTFKVSALEHYHVLLLRYFSNASGLILLATSFRLSAARISEVC